MKKVSLIVKGFVLAGFVMVLIGVTSANAQTVSTIAGGYVQVSDVAFDSSGNMYFSARFQNKIMKMTRDGVVSTFAGSGTYGSVDGPAATAQFKYPGQLTVDSSGNVYVVESSSVSIRKITQAGIVSTVKKFPGEDWPSGIIADASGNLFYFLYRKLYKLEPNGTSTVVAGSGNNTIYDGVGTAASFSTPQGLARDSSGNLYTVEQVLKYNVVRKITPNYTVSEIGDRGKLGNIQTLDVAVDTAGNIYVSGGQSNVIQKVTQAGVISTFAGQASLPGGGTNGDVASATFNYPLGLAFYGGILYVADYNNGAVRIVYNLSGKTCSNTTREFDAIYYADKYPDLKAAFGYDCAQLKTHWDGFGLTEGRQSSPTFSIQAYMNRYPDLVQAFGATGYRFALQHWMGFGIAEGRNPAP